MLNKKGSIIDILTAVVMLLVISVIFILITYIWTQFSGTAFFKTAPSVTNSINTSFSILDDGIVVFFFMTVFSAILLAFFVQSHPVFAIIPIIFLIPLTIIADVFSNLWQSIISNSFLATVGNTYFLYVSTLMKYLPITVLVFSVILMIVMYSKPTATSAVY